MARKLGVESTDGCRFQAGVVAACLRERGVVHMDGVVNYDASKDVLQQQRLAFERDLAAERDPARTRAEAAQTQTQLLLTQAKQQLDAFGQREALYVKQAELLTLQVNQLQQQLAEQTAAASSVHKQSVVCRSPLLPMCCSQRPRCQKAR